VKGGPVAGVGGVQADELPGGAAVRRAGRRDGEHHGEAGPVGQEVEALGGHQAQCPAGPYRRREDGGQVAGPAGAGDAGRAGDRAVAELAEAVQPGCERPGRCCLQGGAGPVPVGCLGTQRQSPYRRGTGKRRANMLHPG